MIEFENIYEQLNILFQDKNLTVLRLLINPVYKKTINISFFEKPFILFINQINKLNFQVRLITIKKIYFYLLKKNTKPICVILKKTDEKNLELENKIKQYLNKDVQFEYQKDETIIQGFKFLYNNKMFDATLNTFLNKLKLKIIKDLEAKI